MRFLRNMSPASSIYNLPDSPRVYPVGFRYGGSRFSITRTGANVNHRVVRQLGVVVKFALASAVCFSVFIVGLLSIPPKIFYSVISHISRLVAGLHPRRTRANKSQEYEAVNVNGSKNPGAILEYNYLSSVFVVFPRFENSPFVGVSPSVIVARPYLTDGIGAISGVVWNFSAVGIWKLFHVVYPLSNYTAYVPKTGVVI